MSRDRFMNFRRSQPPAPRLAATRAIVRGVGLAVFMTPERADRPPLLCVNGGLLYGHDILWPALAPLARNRQLILYDQRGRGESDEPPRAEDARIEDDAADIPALRAALGLSRWEVLGHSWGAGIAMLGAERDQAGTGRVVLVDAVGVSSAWMAPLARDALARLDAARRARLQQFDEWALGDPDPRVQSAWSRALYPAWFADREFAAMFSPPRSESRTGAAVSARLRREGYDWRPFVRALNRPTLVMHGERDLLPARIARELAETLPDARLELIPGSGHMPFWEAPDEFFARVNAFLDQPATPQSADRSAPSAPF